MRTILITLAITTILWGQDTLFTVTGVTYLGEFIEQTDTHVFFKPVDSPRAQAIANAKVQRVGRWDGVTKPAAPVLMDKEFSSQMPELSGETTQPPKGTSGFGIKAGGGWVKFIGDDADKFANESAPYEYLTSYTVGLGYNIKVNNNLSLRPEILYTEKGNMIKWSDSYSEVDYTEEYDIEITTRMLWIEVPVLAVYHLTPKVNIFCGPYLESYLSGEVKIKVKATARMGGETYSQSETDTEDLEADDINALNYGVVFGGGYTINPKLSIEGRYSYGLSSLDKQPENWDDEFGEYEVSDIRNSGIFIMLNYAF